MTVARRVVGILASVMICSLPVAAQSTGTSRGRVLNSASSRGLSNVGVTLEGLQLSVLASLDDAFNVPSDLPVRVA
jgi:hypothetical protein